MTAFAIDRPRVTIAAVVLLVFGGSHAYLALPRDEDPGFTVRQAMVVTHWPGASPVRIEQLVTDPLEKAIQEIPELDFVESESRTGVSAITVHVQVAYTDLRPVWDNLRRKVERAALTLPEGVLGPFVDDEFGDVFGIVIGLTGEGLSYRELKDIADEVRDELLHLDDVAKVVIHGAQEERIFVEYAHGRLAELGLSPLQLRAMLEAQNIVIPGGNIRVDDRRIALEPTGNFASLEDLRRTVIHVPGRPELLYLGDVAEVRRGYADPPGQLVHASGERALALAVSMRSGGNILALGGAVRETLARLEAHYPIGVEFSEIQFQPEAVRAKVNSFLWNLAQAVTLVALVMLLFLGPRTGLIVATLVPLVMLAAFLLMHLLGIGINQVSLAALIIALGMLVDNGIVVAESALVQMRAGKAARAAAIDSARELRWPLLTASLCTTAAFLPFFLAASEAGEYTGALFSVVAITLLSSWVLALTVIPAWCTLFLRVRPEARETSYGTRPYRAYRAVLLFLLRRPRRTAAAAASLLALAVLGLGLVPDMFFPPNERETFTVELELPPGTAIEETVAAAGRSEALLRERYAAGLFDAPAHPGAGITNWGAFIGAGAPRFILTYAPAAPNPEYAIFVVNASDRAVIDALAPRIAADLSDMLPGTAVTAKPLELGPPVGKPLQIRVSGRDEETLFRYVAAVRELLEASPYARDIDDDWGPRTMKLLVTIDQPRARRAGVTSQDIALSLQTHLSGFATTEFREGSTLIPVVMRSAGAARDDIGKLESIQVFAQQTGQTAPLRQVADISPEWQSAKVLRRDRLKTVTLEADLAHGVTIRQAVAGLRPELDALQARWPLGYAYAFGGEHEESRKAQQSIYDQLPLAGLVIVLLLILQFNSYRRPLIVLLIVPMGLIGVTAGLLAVPGMYFGFMTLLGVVALSGIVINNVVVLLDRIRIEQEEMGRAPDQAVVHAAQQRLRPIFLTTATTAIGLLPLYRGGGPLFEPMAVAIIFGLLFATLLTLGLAPVLYALFFRVRFADFVYRGTP